MGSITEQMRVDRNRDDLTVYGDVFNIKEGYYYCCDHKILVEEENAKVDMHGKLFHLHGPKSRCDELVYRSDMDQFVLVV